MNSFQSKKIKEVFAIVSIVGTVLCKPAFSQHSSSLNLQPFHTQADSGVPTLQSVEPLQSSLGKRVDPAFLWQGPRNVCPLKRVSTDKFVVSLPKTVLKKVFLLRANLLPAEAGAIPQSSVPKIVFFQFSGGVLGLFELNHDAASGELFSPLLLQTFPLVQDRGKEIEFEWSYGLSAISLRSKFHFSDGQQSRSGAGLVSVPEPLLPSSTSFVSEMKIDGEQLQIEQISHVQSQSIGQWFRTQQSVRIQMSLSPYRQNIRFKPRLSAFEDGIGFLEIPQTSKGEGTQSKLEYYAARWDLSPAAGFVTYQITQDFPPELVPAVREGVLYWNRVLGRAALRVETGASISSVPRIRTVPIYWKKWGQIQFARADYEADPLTGEMLSGDIFLSSAFDLRSLARKGQVFLGSSLQDQVPTESVARFADSSYFLKQPLCQWFPWDTGSPFSLQKSEMNGLVLLEGYSDRLLRATLDRLRVTIAHEVGHTLGLRHNFAGSLGSELGSAQEHSEAWNRYWKEGESNGKVVASSVMDYLLLEDELLLGAALKTQVLTYDQAAIQWGYADQPIPLQGLQVPHFCSDREADSGKILGCARYDSGREPLEGLVQMLAEDRQSLGEWLVRGFYGQLETSVRGVKRIQERIAQVDPLSISHYLTRRVARIFQHLSQDASTLPIVRQWGPLSWLNRESLLPMTQDALSTSLARIGGLPGILRAAYPLDGASPVEVGWVAKQVEAFLGSSNGQELISRAAWTEEEQLEFKKDSLQFADRLEELYLKDVLFALSGHSGVRAERGGHLEGSPVQNSYFAGIASGLWEEDLGRWLMDLILGEGEKQITGRMDGQSIAIPQTKFSSGLRWAATRLLSAKLFQSDNWMVATRQKIFNSLKESIARVVQEVPSTAEEGAVKFYVDSTRMDPTLRAWVLGELTLLKHVAEVE